MSAMLSSTKTGAFGRRQASERGVRIPVIVLTGFLGAGKTTLLQRFLATPEGYGTAIIVNEFGAIGIDDALLRGTAEDTILLGNGCLCCNTRSDLQNAMHRLVAERERGAIPDFRRIVIETSGLADPSPILQTFATDRAVGDAFHLQGLIACVDAVNGADTLAWSSEARKQAILADTIIVTKTDLADASAIETALRALNHRAAISRSAQGVADPQVLLGTERAEASAFVAEADHSDGIISFTLTEAQPLRWDVVARVIDTLTALRGRDLLRVKGFLNVTDTQGPVLLQVVQHLMHPPIELQQWPDETRESRVVFITRNISEAQVRALFDAVRALSAS